MHGKSDIDNEDDENDEDDEGDENNEGDEGDEGDEPASAREGTADGACDGYVCGSDVDRSAEEACGTDACALDSGADPEADGDAAVYGADLGGGLDEFDTHF